VLRAHVLPAWSAYRLRDIERLRVQQWIAEKFRRGTGWQVVRNSWTLLSSILESAVEFGYLQANPARGMKFPQKALKRKPTIIAGTDFAKLLARLDEPYKTMVSLLVLRSISDYVATPSELWSMSTLTSAGDFYGGFMGGLLAAAWFFWRHRDVPFWRVADLCAPAIALGQAIGRIGCFMAGDDYGRATTVRWAVTFTDPDAARIGGAPLGVPLHPVQLYESAVCLVLFSLLVLLGRRRHRDGDLILTYTALYAIARFVLEFFRGDADRGFVFGGVLSTSQFIGIIMLGLVVGVLIARPRTRVI
jgi:prolipoprotein diacylglyceryl transferase